MDFQNGTTVVNNYYANQVVNTYGAAALQSYPSTGLTNGTTGHQQTVPLYQANGIYSLGASVENSLTPSHPGIMDAFNTHSGHLERSAQINMSPHKPSVKAGTYDGLLNNEQFISHKANFTSGAYNGMTESTQNFSPPEAGCKLSYYQGLFSDSSQSFSSPASGSIWSGMSTCMEDYGEGGGGEGMKQYLNSTPVQNPYCRFGGADSNVTIFNNSSLKKPAPPNKRDNPKKKRNARRNLGDLPIEPSDGEKRKTIYETSAFQYLPPSYSTAQNQGFGSVSPSFQTYEKPSDTFMSYVTDQKPPIMQQNYQMNSTSSPPNQAVSLPISCSEELNIESTSTDSNGSTNLQSSSKIYTDDNLASVREWSIPQLAKNGSGPNDGGLEPKIKRETKNGTNDSMKTTSAVNLPNKLKSFAKTEANIKNKNEKYLNRKETKETLASDLDGKLAIERNTKFTCIEDDGTLIGSPVLYMGTSLYELPNEDHDPNSETDPNQSVKTRIRITCQNCSEKSRNDTSSISFSKSQLTHAPPTNVDVSDVTSENKSSKGSNSKEISKGKKKRGAQEQLSQIYDTRGYEDSGIGEETKDSRIEPVRSKEDEKAREGCQQEKGEIKESRHGIKVTIEEVTSVTAATNGTHQCQGCQKPVRDRYVLHVRDNGYWHADCLKCSNCQDNLSGQKSCYVKNEQVFCRNDYNILFGLSCVKCSLQFKKEQDWMRVAGQHRYHIACFLCKICKRQLGNNEKYHLVNGTDIYCTNHYRDMVNGENGDGQQPPKKAKRNRTSYTEAQIKFLQERFIHDSNPDGNELEKIANHINLKKRVVQVWFQNNRARLKKSANNVKGGNHENKSQGNGNGGPSVLHDPLSSMEWDNSMEPTALDDTPYTSPPTPSQGGHNSMRTAGGPGHFMDSSPYPLGASLMSCLSSAHGQGPSILNAGIDGTGSSSCGTPRDQQMSPPFTELSGQGYPPISSQDINNSNSSSCDNTTLDDINNPHGDFNNQHNNNNNNLNNKNNDVGNMCGDGAQKMSMEVGNSASSMLSALRNSVLGEAGANKCSKEDSRRLEGVRERHEQQIRQLMMYHEQQTPPHLLHNQHPHSLEVSTYGNHMGWSGNVAYPNYFGNGVGQPGGYCFPPHMGDQGLSPGAMLSDASQQGGYLPQQNPHLLHPGSRDLNVQSPDQHDTSSSPHQLSSHNHHQTHVYNHLQPHPPHHNQQQHPGLPPHHPLGQGYGEHSYTPSNNSPYDNDTNKTNSEGQSGNRLSPKEVLNNNNGKYNFPVAEPESGMTTGQAGKVSTSSTCHYSHIQGQDDVNLRNFRGTEQGQGHTNMLCRPGDSSPPISGKRQGTQTGGQYHFLPVKNNICHGSSYFRENGDS